MKRFLPLLGLVCATAWAQVDLPETPDPGLNAFANRNVVTAFVGDPQSGIAYAYDLDGDNVPDATGHTMQATFQDEGTITVTLLTRSNIEDPWVVVESTTVDVDASPILAVKFPGEPEKAPPAYIGEPYAFEIQEDSFLPLTSVAWRIVDADGVELATGTGPAVSHTFGAVNKYTPLGTTYTVEITLTNAITSKTFDLDIIPAPAPREELLRFFELALKDEQAAFSAIDKMIRASLGYYGVDISEPSPIAPGVPMEVFLRQRLGEVSKLRALQAKHAELDAEVKAGLLSQEEADQLKATTYKLPDVPE